MGNIVLLDDLTINKIAAGEVIERPASVVKEMVENSIDAGAKNINIEIKNGGISLIRITDDGCGIAEDDIEIAFERHATSKIRSADDLLSVKSMGFRGEALASIAAIAKIEMVSKKEGTEVAHKIVVEGGKTLEFTESARSVGTTITVENLFYNTPVRYKFLKKDYTEAGYIEDVVTRIALVNPNIAIKLISNGKTIVQTNGNGDLKTVVYSLYGKDVATETIEVNYEYEGIKVSGIIGKPVIARANRSNQLFFLNGRYIKDKNLTAAADQSYKGMIPIGRYGFIILNLEMDPKFVDVNVHPAKLEVRFQDETQVFKAVYHAIKSHLAKSELVANVEKNAKNVLEVNFNNSNEFNRNFDEIKINSNFNNDLNNRLNNQNTDGKKSGISGLFKKIKKDADSDEENNPLAEIFRYRQEITNSANSISSNKVSNIASVGLTPNNDLVNSTVNTAEARSIQSTTPLNNVISAGINTEEISKKVTLGNTLISSDTTELNVNGLNLSENENNLKLEDTVENLKLEDVEKTQKIDLATLNTTSQETTVAENNFNTKSQETMVIDKTEEVQEKENNVEESDFSSIAGQLLESKLGFDNTQMIDTSKIRAALKEEKFENNPEFDEMYKKTFGVDPFTVRKEKALEKKEEEKYNASNEFSYAEENMNVFEAEGEDTYPEIPYKFLGIAFNTYIIIEIKNEMYIIDQHAAHERIMYEKIKANYYSNDAKDEQFLLLPDVISLTHKEMIIAKENKDMFEKAGFSFEEFGDNTIKLTSVPSMCENLDTKQLFLDILDEIDTVAVTARQEKEDKFIATVACKSAVKGKMKLDDEEVSSLMEKLLELPNPFTCPHGRPTAIKMTQYDLEKKFSRR